ncbi:glycerol-3-phosphate dehydrogenase/oxidase [Winogradskyella alexanderae]|uniref:Glycerol-3-phosphate dehydrogenase/oxidase n=1 Tax=Winogradskyella alexanderae TaxID=2877123 RepID=A0ABS7XSV7_9FLAO|nr:glycerol-3-phosphate dehydrogenase/oxidase [Winogradskyella alexanderae]MCA0132503.1 glycerol-3-phosphate dehydrogenase/oxidase [Winogradskyella alexanderae]
MFDRTYQLEKLKSTEQFDLVVIGGGASGLGIAVDAVSRGFTVALFESHDFGKGTSSRSTKLVHGGVRYLAQGNIKLVIEALRERGLLEKNANHLFKRQTFLIPSYNWWFKYYYGFGLTIYDWLAAKLSLGGSRIISASKASKRIKNLKSEGLNGGVTYLDGQFDDARLALNLAQTATELGAVVLNHCKVDDISKDDNGQVSGVSVLDTENNEEMLVNARVVINATGVFANKILKLAGRKKRSLKIVPSQGIHLVLDKSFLEGDTALMVPKTSDGRVLFAIPWHNKVVVGTTDTPIKKPSYEPKPLEEEIEFILETAKAYFTKTPNREDVKSVFAGLRPLVAPEGDKSNTKEISRGHKIIHSESGLITIVGGKWTTYREMSEDVVNEAIDTHRLPKVKSKTRTLSIHGNVSSEEKANLNSVNWFYGSDAKSLEEFIEADTSLQELLHQDYEFTVGQVIWAIRFEMARTIEDILARRIRLLFLDAQACLDITEKVADIITKELNKSNNWKQNQIQEFKTLASGYLI